MKKDGWLRCLFDYIEIQSKSEYKLGENDCVRFCCGAIEAMTGVDHWPELGGHYSTRAEAIAFIRAMAGDLTKFVTQKTGYEAITAMFAQRGDLVIYEDEKGKHLAICVGEMFTAFREDGFIYLPMSKGVTAAWRVA